MSIYVVLFGILIAPLHSCSQVQVQGRIIMKRYIFDADPERKSVEIATNVWYCGNQSIQEVPSIDMITTSTENSVKTPVKYYLLIDSASGWHVYFRNFADTAQVIAKSRKQDLFSKYGGWNLYASRKFEYDSKRQLTDTIIEGNRLTRHDLFRIRDKDSFNFITYASCLHYNEKIWYLLSIAKQIGCPVIRMDTYYNGRLTGKMEIEYTSHELSHYERKVFEAWGKYIK
jgi:hypothetical protein